MKNTTTILLASLAAAHAALPELPQPATSFGATISGGHLYVYGGNTGKAHEFNRECVKGDFFRLKIDGGTEWEKLPGGLALLSCSLVEHDGKIIRIGGMNARNAKGEENDLYSTDEVMRFDPATQKWTALPSLPAPRSSHDSAIMDGVLYVGGGWTLKGDDGEGAKAEWQKTLLSLDLRKPDAAWQQTPQPFQRRALATVAAAGRLWFLGGMDADDEPSRAVDWFEPATGKWGKGPDLPDGAMAGFGIAGCADAKRVLASPLSGKISTLSEDGSKWVEIATLTPARFFHRLLPVANGRVLAVGGSNRKGHVRPIEIVDLNAKKQTAPDAPAGASSKDAKQPSEPDSAAAWPQWRGPNRDGISTETGWSKDWPEAGPAQLWRANIGQGISSPVVSQGRLIVHGNDGEGRDSVTALDAATGAELWRHTFACKSDPHEMPIVPAGPGATPTVHGARVFALSREGDLLCLAAASGEVVWRKNLVTDLGGKRPVYGFTQSPLVDGGRIYLDVGAAEGGTGSTVALDAATGEVKWRAGSGEAGYSSARILERDGRRFLAVFKGEALDLYDASTGALAWSHRTTARDYSNSLTPVFVGHRILVSNTGTDPAALLDWDVGAEPRVRHAWKHPQFALLFNNAILHDGALFAFNEKRRGRSEFTCVDAASGETRWVSDALPISTFILADGHWLMQGREGEVILAPASTTAASVAKKFRAFEGKCYATPALAGGRLYLRSNAGELAAYNLRK